MKTAVMQPYFFPYIGYYQLLAVVDTFVILDDVNFIKRGWINRNNILLNGKAHLFSLPLDKPSQNKLISETKLYFPQRERCKFLKKIQAAYQKAPMFKEFEGALERVVMFEEDDLTGFIQHSFDVVCNYLGMSLKVVRSTDIEKDSSLRAQDRIIELCKRIGTSEYFNLVGGKALYDRESFQKEGMALGFVSPRTDEVEYKQFKNDFVPNLSMLDVLMFNERKAIVSMLSKYELS